MTLARWTQPSGPLCLWQCFGRLWPFSGTDIVKSVNSSCWYFSGMINILGCNSTQYKWQICPKINHLTFHWLKVNQLKQAETLASFNNKKAEFEKLRSDVQIKLKFLDENRVKVTSLYHVSSYTWESDIQKRERIWEFLQVMQKQLLLFHNAVAGYFSGNQTALDATMKQFAIKVLGHSYSRILPEPTWHPCPTFCHLGSPLDPRKQRKWGLQFVT